MQMPPLSFLAQGPGISGSTDKPTITKLKWVKKAIIGLLCNRQLNTRPYLKSLKSFRKHACGYISSYIAHAKLMNMWLKTHSFLCEHIFEKS